jgi:hypothetical protein
VNQESLALISSGRVDFEDRLTAALVVRWRVDFARLNDQDWINHCAGSLLRESYSQSRVKEHAAKETMVMAATNMSKKIMGEWLLARRAYVKSSPSGQAASVFMNSILEEISRGSK